MTQFIFAAGILGGLLFVIAAVWLAWRTYANHGEVGTPLSFSWMVWCALVLTYCYLLGLTGFDWIVFLTYGIQIVCWAIVIWFSYFPVRK